MQHSHPTALRYDLLKPSVFFTPLLLLFAIVLLFIALIYEQKEMSIFSVMILVGAVVLKLWSSFSTHDIACRAFVNRSKLFPSEKVAFYINIKNNKLLPVFIKISWRIKNFLQTDGREISIEEQSGLFWHQGITFHRECIAQKRGCYQIGSPALTTGDFFGFFPKDLTGNQPLDILVYPRRVPIKPFPLLKRIIFGKPGVTSPVRDPVYVLGTRDYQPFRPARYIHWKASARHHRLQEKIFEPAEQDKLLLVLDVDGFYANGAHDEFEQAIEALAALAAELESQNYAVGLITNAGSWNKNTDFFLPVARHPGHGSAMLEMLAKIEIRPKEKLANLLDQVENLPADAICVYFSYDIHFAKTYFNQRQIPTVNIVCKTVPDDGFRSLESMSAGSIHYLTDILVTVEKNEW